jgi:quinol-cytochrome oxidoreductase complex cytochrome b subunit
MKPLYILNRYCTPSNLTLNWNWGVLGLVFLSLQIMTGLVLVMNYLPDATGAFMSVEHIMREIPSGYIFRYLHANGASFLFLVIYYHILRGLVFGSYLPPREKVWGVGIIIFLIMVLTAFAGYVLPWGQMSYWALTVISNLVTIIPGLGEALVVLFWGSPTIGTSTVTRLFLIHFLIPFVLLVLVLIHIVLLHNIKSSSPLTIQTNTDSVDFSPFYILKDALVVVIIGGIFSIFVTWIPNFLGHSDNYIIANPFVTPTHIVPEWYFLPYFAVLRSFDSKTLGVISLFLSILLPILLGFTTKYYYNKLIGTRYIFTYIIAIFIFVTSWYELLAIGSASAEEPYLAIGHTATWIYFFILGVVLDIIIVSLSKFKRYFVQLSKSVGTNTIFMDDSITEEIKGNNILKNNIIIPLGFGAIITKVFSLINAGSIDIFDVDIKWIIIFVIGGLFINLLLDKLHNKDSSPKAGTKTKSSVPAMGSGAGSKESSPESDDDDSKNKSLWEKVKNFCYNHRTEIAIGIVALISIIIYGQYKKPSTPPTPPTGDNPKPKTSDAATQTSEDNIKNPFIERDAYKRATYRTAIITLAIKSALTNITEEEFLVLSPKVVPIVATLIRYGADEPFVSKDIPLILDRIVSRVSWLRFYYATDLNPELDQELTRIDYAAKQCLNNFRKDSCTVYEIIGLAQVLSMHPPRLNAILDSLEMDLDLFQENNDDV